MTHLQIEHVVFTTRRIGSGGGDSYESTYLDQLNELLASKAGQHVVAVQHVHFLYATSADAMAGRAIGAEYMLTRRG